MKGKAAICMAAAIVLLVSLALAGCARQYQPSRTGVQGGAAGAAVGATAGALLDEDNRWRGGVIGGALGAALGGALGEISNRASREAARRDQPVVYTNQAGTRRVEAYPRSTRGDCQIVKEKYYEHGELVKVTEREVCP
jgi:uncharacterized membrane protein